MKIDLHLHTTASDGTDTPAELVKKAWDAGIKVISITDHDTIAGLAEAHAALPAGMCFFDGIELSSAVYGEGGFRCHILGYDFDIKSCAIAGAIDEGMRKRREKLYARLDYIKEKFGITFSDEDVKELESFNSVSKLHIARLLIKDGYATDISDAMDRYFGVNAPDDRIDATLAINSIRAARGFSVWAHPLGGEREPRIDADELYRRAKILKDMGVDGIEAYYSRYNATDRAMILDVARRLSLWVSGGSDYHGKNKTVALGLLDADGKSVTTMSLSICDILMP